MFRRVRIFHPLLTHITHLNLPPYFPRTPRVHPASAELFFRSAAGGGREVSGSLRFWARASRARRRRRWRRRLQLPNADATPSKTPIRCHPPAHVTAAPAASLLWSSIRKLARSLRNKTERVARPSAARSWRWFESVRYQVGEGG